MNKADKMVLVGCCTYQIEFEGGLLKSEPVLKPHQDTYFNLGQIACVTRLPMNPNYRVLHLSNGENHIVPKEYWEYLKDHYIEVI